MFSPQIIDSDAFLDMPNSAQCLYFHLGMRADDDGFVGNPKKVSRIIGANEDDLKILLAKRFILSFKSGVVVIKHWLIHNIIRADIYKETLYKKEKNSLGLNENGSYTEMRDGVNGLTEIEAPKWLKIRRGELRTANGTQTARRIGKERLGKVIESDAVAPTLIDLFNKVINLEKGQEQDKLDFIAYWEEKSPTGKKCRWEKESVFDISRRWSTWIRNKREWGGKKVAPKTFTFNGKTIPAVLVGKCQDGDRIVDIYEIDGFGLKAWNYGQWQEYTGSKNDLIK